MLEIYSLEQTVQPNIAIPLNNIVVEKGCTAVNSAPATIQLNKCGVYMVTVDASAEAVTAGDIEINLVKDGVVQPQAQSTVTGATGETDTLGFTTLVQVSHNNSNCCCSSPTVIQLMNVGVETTYHNINVCVTKIC